MNMISIDPGKHGCFCCAWENDQMVGVAVCVDPIPDEVDLVVCEMMQVHQGRYSADLIDVMCTAARVSANVPRDKIMYVTPSEWKGQCPKAIHQKTRIIPHISRTEMDMFSCVAPSLKHNFIDAFGIGMWLLRSKGLWTRD